MLHDVEDGYVSVEAARKEYRVVIVRDEFGICSIDEEATKILRAAVST